MGRDINMGTSGKFYSSQGRSSTDMAVVLLDHNWAQALLQVFVLGHIGHS